MRRITMTAAAVALLAGPLLSAGAAQAAQRPQDTTPYAPTPTPVIQPLDCQGTTGSMGCGPGYYWRNGDQGWRCYPC
jgi:hypothetical protein